MVAGMAVIMANTSYRRPYILCPDVLAGHSHSDGFKDALGKRVRDAKIAGEDYPPLGTKDFAPYITKIIASRADVVMLGLFGPDFPTFVKQSRSLGLKDPFPMFTILGDPYQMNELRAFMGLTCLLCELSVARESRDAKKMNRNSKMRSYLTWWPLAIGGVSGCKMFRRDEKAGSTVLKK
jgi:hypothetical protein